MARTSSYRAKMLSLGMSDAEIDDDIEEEMEDRRYTQADLDRAVAAAVAAEREACAKLCDSSAESSVKLAHEKMRQTPPDDYLASSLFEDASTAERLANIIRARGGKAGT